MDQMVWMGPYVGTWLRLALLLLVVNGPFPAAPSSPAPSPPRSPHILFIMMDDVGWHDVSYHEGSPLHTPHINELAGRGVKLEQHYAHSTCTPSRAALLTGRYSFFPFFLLVVCSVFFFFLAFPNNPTQTKKKKIVYDRYLTTTSGTQLLWAYPLQCSTAPQPAYLRASQHYHSS